jgi:hypothetical protein
LQKIIFLRILASTSGSNNTSSSAADVQPQPGPWPWPTQLAIDPSTLDPALLQLGIVSGLLSASNGSVALNTDFFADPIGHLEQIPCARADELAALLTQLLGASSDSANGLPGASADRQWIPITYTDSTGKVRHTGCCVVLETVTTDSQSTTVFGLGAMYQSAERHYSPAPSRRW